jgi:hypothetical protein
LEGKQLTFPHVLYATRRDVNLTNVKRRKGKREEKRKGQKEDKTKQKVKEGYCLSSSFTNHRCGLLNLGIALECQ